MLVAGVMLRNQASDEFLRDASILFWSLNGYCSASVTEDDYKGAPAPGRDHPP
jgi:hypothetical protein